MNPAALGPYTMTSSQIFSHPAWPNSVDKYFTKLSFLCLIWLGIYEKFLSMNDELHVLTLTEIQYTLSILQVYFVCTSKKKSTIEVYFIHTSRKKSINEVYFLDVLHLYLKYYSVLQVYFFNWSILQVYFETWKHIFRITFFILNLRRIAEKFNILVSVGFIIIKLRLIMI